MLLAVVLAFSFLPGAAFAADVPTQEEAYQAMIALKSQYPEGMKWNNSNSYRWHGSNMIGAGCVGFAFILSDAAFGTLPARTLYNFEYSDVRVGDILRINNDTHSVIVLEVKDSGVVIAEGNYNNSIHWGRTLSKATVETADYLMTRYPVVQEESEEPTRPENPFTDVPAGTDYTDAIIWAASSGIVEGYGNGLFGYKDKCTEAQILTMLWRFKGEPEAADSHVTASSSYQKAVDWAYAEHLIDEDFVYRTLCTRARAVWFIWKVMAADGETGPDYGFTDVDDETYIEAVNWAVNKGITKGTSVTTFTPNRVCERRMIATFLYRAYQSL